jgi:hypothetical protein
MPKNQEIQRPDGTMEDFILSQQDWEKLQAGDLVEVNAPEQETQFTTVLKKENGVTTFSLMSPLGACTSFLANCKFDDGSNHVIDTNGNHVNMFDHATNIRTGMGKKEAADYAERIKDANNMSEERFYEIFKKIQDQANAIADILQDRSLNTLPQKMSVILNLVFGKDNYTEEQLCALSTIIMYYEYQLSQRYSLSGIPGITVIEIPK